jgi:hypothetical protein
MIKDSKLIWFDFDNSPHVPVLLPIVKETRYRGYKTILTARDKSETKELLSLNNEKFKVIGKSFPKNKFLKIYYTFERALKLIYYLKKNVNKKLIMSVTHGSRSALLASWLIRIPSVMLTDYEYANSIFGNIFATKFLMPKLFTKDRLKEAGILINKVDFYPGIKEQIYINSNLKKENVLECFGIDKSKIIITFRPPSIIAHYHNPESEIIMREIFNKISQYKDKIFIIILPRTKEQGEDISNFVRRESIPHLIPEKPLNGIDLILSSDLVLGGGGTMTREAAVLGVPSYSFFKGPKGAVDEFLEKNGRLIFIDSILNIKNLHFEKKQKEMNILQGNQKKIISFICDRLESLTT